MKQFWIAVASADHVRLGRSMGFMQVCHGKAAPLRRIRPGDMVIYYSPSTEFRGKDKLQSFTAIGICRDVDPYQVEMSPGFCPFRRDVDWFEANETPIQSLLELLEFSKGNKNWGYQLRFGLFPISAHDASIIAESMGAVVGSKT